MAPKKIAFHYYLIYISLLIRKAANVLFIFLYYEWPICFLSIYLLDMSLINLNDLFVIKAFTVCLSFLQKIGLLRDIIHIP